MTFFKKIIIRVPFTNILFGVVKERTRNCEIGEGNYSFKWDFNKTFYSTNYESGDFKHLGSRYLKVTDEDGIEYCFYVYRKHKPKPVITLLPEKSKPKLVTLN
jgi:hypothetical protein